MATPEVSRMGSQSFIPRGGGFRPIHDRSQCLCHETAMIKTSWSKKNPRQRYYKWS